MPMLQCSNCPLIRYVGDDFAYLAIPGHGYRECSTIADLLILEVYTLWTMSWAESNQSSFAQHPTQPLQNSSCHSRSPNRMARLSACQPHALWTLGTLGTSQERELGGGLRTGLESIARKWRPEILCRNWIVPPPLSIERQQWLLICMISMLFWNSEQRRNSWKPPKNIFGFRIPLLQGPSSTIFHPYLRGPTLISSSSMARLPRGATAMAFCRACRCCRGIHYQSHGWLCSAPAFCSFLLMAFITMVEPTLQTPLNPLRFF